MSNNQPAANSSCASGCAKFAGYGCTGIFVLYVIGTLTLFGGGGGAFGSLVLVAIVVTIVVLALKQNKKKPFAAPVAPAAMANSASEVSAPRVDSAVDHTMEAEFVKSPLCHHTFSKLSLQGNQTLECSCGHRIAAADLRELEDVKQGIRDLETRRASILTRIKGMQIASTLATTSTTSTTNPYAKSAPKPKVAKPRRAISTQQWLVIGASILIFVAGMVFVSTNLNRLPQWAFLLITGGLAIATGLGSIYMRTISSLLASFFTAFSASMQLAALAIIGDQLNESFLWNNAPAWWWLISLGVIAVIAGTLSKFTRIYGWKALALLATAASALVLELGVLLDRFVATAATVHLAILSITAVATLWLAKTLRRIPAIEEKDESLQTYAKDLAQREDASLRWFAVGAAALQLTAGVGIVALKYVPIATTPLHWLPLLALAAVWVGVAASATRWSGQLRQDGEQLAEFASISRYVVQVALALAAVSASTLLQPIWLSLAIALGVLIAINLFSSKISAIKPTPYTSLSFYAAASLAWVIWQASSAAGIEDPEAIPAFVAGASIALAVGELRYRVNKFAWVTGVGFSGALVWLATLYSQRFDDRTGWVFALLTFGLMLAANLSLVIRELIAKRVQQKPPIGFEWLGLAVASTLATIQLALVSESSQSITIIDLIPMVAALLSYAALSLAWGGFTKFGREHGWLMQGHSYLGQVLLLVIMLASAESLLDIQDWIYTGLLLSLALLNYSFGWLRKQATSLQVGFGLVIAAIIPLQNLGGSGDLVLLAVVSIVVITSVAFLHERLLGKLTKIRTKLVEISMLSGLSLGLIFMLGTQAEAWNNSTLIEQLIVQGLLWVIGLGTTVRNWVATRAAKPISNSVWWVAIIYVVFAVALSFVQTSDWQIDLKRWQWLLSALVLGLTLAGNYRAKPWPWLIAPALFANLVAGYWAGEITATALDSGSAPEPYTVWMAIALAGTTLLVGGRIFGWRPRLLLDVPILGIAMGSFGYALWLGSPESNETLIRGIVSLAVIAGFGYWRSGRELPIAWLAVGYLAGAGSATYLTEGIATWTGWDYNGPEPLSVLLGASVAVGNYFAVKRLGDRLVETRTILMLTVLTLPTLIHSVAVPQDLVDARLRQILALAVVAGVALWRLNRDRSLFWGIPGYVAGAGSMSALANLLHERVWPEFVGPELYSIPVLVSVLVGHAFFLPRITLKSSWVAWGIPMAVGLLPSAFDTAVVASTAFEDLTLMQIARVILVLVLSTALLVFGVRLGNLANTAVGLSGLALLLVPNTALQSDQVLAGTQVESTALVIGVLVFIALAVAKRQGLLKGRSTIFIGIPIAIIMGPALVRSLIALANPSLTNVDWWRFGILLAAGLALLIVGALRELGGMFFPGLVSVLLTALPYAFMQSKDQEWFLWVVLLIVATAMIWVALRLEKLRKLGRDSANWVRELK